MTLKHKETLRFGLFALLVICLRYPLLAMGTHTFFDVDWAVWCEPVAQYNRASLLSGHLPAWCPLVLNGVPYLAQWNTMVLYPGIWLYVLLPLHTGMNWFQLLHATFGAIGMYLLARRLNKSNHLGACIIGLSYQLNGFALNIMGWQQIANYAWAPWVILSQLKAMQLGRQWLAWAALTNGLQLATGIPEFNLITWTFSLAMGFAGTTNRPEALRALKRFTTTVALGSLIAAAQLIPSAVLIHSNGNSVRGMERPDWAFDGAALINFIDPTYFMEDYGFTDRPRAQNWLTVHYTNLGLTTLAIVMAWIYRRSKFVSAIFLAAAVWSILAMGWRHPIIGGIIEHVPVVSRIRYPIKFLFAPVLAIHLLACLFWRGSGKDAIKASLRLTVALPILTVLLGTVFGIIAQDSKLFFPAKLVRLTLHTACGIGCLAVLHCSRKRPVFAAATSGLLLVNSWVATREPNPVVAVSIYSGTPISDYLREHGLPTQTTSAGRLHLPNGTASGKGTFETEVTRRRLWAHNNSNMNEGLYKQDGALSVNPSWQKAWMDRLERLLNQQNTAGTPDHMLDFCSVNLIAERGPLVWNERSNSMRFVSIGQQPMKVADEKSALDEFQKLDFDPRKTVLLLQDPRSGGDSTATATINARAAEKWVIETVASHPTMLVVSQTWYPGWRATVNGKPAEILRANVAFQAVQVPAGKSVVELRYTEPGLKAGALISVLSLAGCLAYLLHCRKRARPGEFSPSSASAMAAPSSSAA